MRRPSQRNHLPSTCQRSLSDRSSTGGGYRAVPGIAKEKRKRRFGIGDWGRGRDARSTRGSLVIGYRLSGKRKKMRGAGERWHPAGPARRLAGRLTQRKRRFGTGDWRLGKSKRRAQPDRGRNGTLAFATPPSEPDVRISRIRRYGVAASGLPCIADAAFEPHDDGLQAVFADHGGYKPPLHAATSCPCSCWSGRDAHSP